MEKGIEPTIVGGDELRKIETIDRIKQILIDFLRGYPIWKYWGIFEFYFKGELGKEIIKALDRHDIIEVVYAKKEGEKTYYSLTPKGVEIAISLSNRDDSKRVLKYAQETHYFSKVLIWLTYIIASLTFGLFAYGFLQGIISLWF